MADPPPYPGTPRWVKVSGIAVGVLLLLAAVLMLHGGGPGRHMPSGDAPGQMPPEEDGHR